MTDNIQYSHVHNGQENGTTAMGVIDRKRSADEETSSVNGIESAYITNDDTKYFPSPMDTTVLDNMMIVSEHPSKKIKVDEGFGGGELHQEEVTGIGMKEAASVDTLVTNVDSEVPQVEEAEKESSEIIERVEEIIPEQKEEEADIVVEQKEEINDNNNPEDMDISNQNNSIFGGSEVSVTMAEEQKSEKQQLEQPQQSDPNALLNMQLKWCLTALRVMKRHNDAGPFLKPVDPIALGIPDYFNVIKEPMDLHTIEQRLNNKEYATHESFCADVELMLQNCFTYNPPSHPVHVMGRNLEKSYQNQLKKIPKPGDELKVETKQVKGARSINPSPLSSRPQRDVHPPTNYWPEDPRSGKKSKRATNELRWCQNVHRELTKKQYEAFMFPFYLPVDPVALNIPQYIEIIKNPMDLSTMKKKLDAGEYEAASEYEADFRLMVNNCFTFNRPGDDVYVMGQKAEELFNRKWSEKPDFNARDSFGLSHHNHSNSGGFHSSAYNSNSRPNKSKSRDYQFDFDTSTDDEVDADTIQIQMIEQQIQLLQKQVEALRQKRRRKMDKRKEKSASSRRSSKGSNMENVGVGIADAVEKPPPKPKKPKGKVGRPKKTYDPPEIREITFEEKKELSEAIPLLSADKLNNVVKIIHESMPHLKDNAGDEIELDIDSLDLVTLNKLWYFVRGSKKRKGKGMDPAANASRISELEMQLAMIDGRPDKVSRFQGIGNDSSSDSSGSDDSDDSDSGSE